ncbi:MAG: DUF1223 domain-containing protein [Planctomycetaceae bacterium]
MMLSNRWSLTVLLFCLAGCVHSAAAADGQGFAVVELFTSEGCSSCPPADALLAKLDAEAKKSGLEVYCLSFHVDYWNRLGWKDPFSQPAFTRRQQEYAQSFDLQRIYTPQMVVNGAEEFVGSNQKLAVKSIETSLSHKVTTTMAIKAFADGKNIAVEYQLQNAPADAVLSVAWTQAEATSNPNRGENDGRKLRHINVVRDFRTIELKSPFQGQLSLQRQDVKTGTVIAFVQAADTGKILGATSAECGARGSRATKANGNYFSVCLHSSDQIPLIPGANLCRRIAIKGIWSKECGQLGSGELGSGVRISEIAVLDVATSHASSGDF